MHVLLERLQEGKEDKPVTLFAVLQCAEAVMKMGKKEEYLGE